MSTIQAYTLRRQKPKWTDGKGCEEVKKLESKRVKNDDVAPARGAGNKLLDEFEEWLLSKKFATSTIRLYSRMAGHFLVWLHSNDRSVRKVGNGDLLEFKTHSCVCNLGGRGAGRYRRTKPVSKWVFVGVVHFLEFLESSGYTDHPGEHSLGKRLVSEYVQKCKDKGYSNSTIAYIEITSGHLLYWLHSSRISILEVTTREISRFLCHHCVCLNCTETVIT